MIENFGNRQVAALPLHLKSYIVPQHYAHYTPIDQAVWRYVMRQNYHFLKDVAHYPYIPGLVKAGLTIERIPSLQEMNEALGQIGWGAVTVDGFIPPAAFMEFQACRVLDMDANGCPVNGHPLSVKEANALARSLLVAEKKQRNFLNPKGLLSSDIVFVRTGNDGFAVWRTPSQKVKLLFSDSLGIPCGEADIPPLLWKASKNSLSLFAVLDEKVVADTALYHAPFFNVYAGGRVCMGNVAVKIPNDCCLEVFMALWRDYFFNSYFSHLFGQHKPVQGNIVQLWHKLITNGEQFPIDCLVVNNIPLNQLIQ